MRRIAIINQKGGVGKTTTTANLGAALAIQGRRVVLIDMDAQANLSLALGVEARSGEPTSYSVLVGDEKVGACLRDTQVPGLRLLPSNIDLSGAEMELASAMGREFLLRDALREWDEEHRKRNGRPAADYVLFDCPPSLGLLSINALAAAGEVLVTLQTEFLALQGMSKLIEIVQLLKKRLNPELSIAGIVPTLYDSRLKLAREVLGEIRRYFKDQVVPHPVRANVKLAEAPSFAQTIFEYAPDSHGALDYVNLARELVLREARDPDLAGLPAFDPSARLPVPPDASAPLPRRVPPPPRKKTAPAIVPTAAPAKPSSVEDKARPVPDRARKPAASVAAPDDSSSANGRHAAREPDIETARAAAHANGTARRESAHEGGAEDVRALPGHTRKASPHEAATSTRVTGRSSPATQAQTPASGASSKSVTESPKARKHSASVAQRVVPAASPADSKSATSTTSARNSSARSSPAQDSSARQSTARSSSPRSSPAHSTSAQSSSTQSSPAPGSSSQSSSIQSSSAQSSSAQSSSVRSSSVRSSSARNSLSSSSGTSASSTSASSTSGSSTSSSPAPTSAASSPPASAASMSKTAPALVPPGSRKSVAAAEAAPSPTRASAEHDRSQGEKRTETKLVVSQESRPAQAPVPAATARTQSRIVKPVPRTARGADIPALPPDAFEILSTPLDP